jgi:hypothetical protein
MHAMCRGAINLQSSILLCVLLLVVVRLDHGDNQVSKEVDGLDQGGNQQTSKPRTHDPVDVIPVRSAGRELSAARIDVRAQGKERREKASKCR